MKLVLRPALPRRFRSHPKARGIRVAYEYDLRLSGGSRLRAKVLVFRRRKDLRAFWSRVLGSGLGYNCPAAVQALLSEGFNPTTNVRRLYADPRYFCVVGLCETEISAEVLAHESVHIGYAYAKRVRRSPWAPRDSIDEEEVAYPAGRAARALNRFFHRVGLWR